MTKEEYFTGSDVSNYYITTAYLQDTSETILRDLVDRIQKEFRRRGDQMAAKKKVDVSKSLNEIIDNYTKEINTDRPIKKGTELVSLGRLETQDEYLLDILKENGFYLMYQKRETKFGELEYWQILYPEELLRRANDETLAQGSDWISSAATADSAVEGVVSDSRTSS